MTDQGNQPSPGLHSVEGNWFGALFGFHEKLMALLRGAGLAGDKWGVASERIGHCPRRSEWGNAEALLQIKEQFGLKISLK